jgi:hypothetical protein
MPGLKEVIVPVQEQVLDTIKQMSMLDGSLSHRVLVDFSGRLPSTMRSMDCLPQYRSIADNGV